MDKAKLLLGGTLAIVVGVAGLTLAKQPPPVVLHLGPLLPTPVPSPEHAEKIRMVTSLTLQNKPDGESLISFEATDFGRSDKGEYRIVASRLYSLGAGRAEGRVLRKKILLKLRDLENDMLEYVEVVGPPQVRQPLTGSGAGAVGR